MITVLHLASGNAHKLAEFRALASAGESGDQRMTIVRAKEMPPVEEDTGTFAGNARKKALALQTMLGPEAWVLADDSGLLVDALKGGPGVESAYFAGPQGDPAANLRKLHDVMRGVPEANRGARFYCLLLLRGPGGREEIFEGECAGRLASAPAGGGGFGYDPMFIPEGFSCTYAELGEAEKNRLSHRARAWQKLDRWNRTAESV
ncbi:MAG TPA: non-canonical purine NTP pyrophosphatase [Candidatus Didemnitutus sp.]|nr:non-canonical purine NTP pyrophosphatase [Candidatus Didemnitutus sp.]